MGKSANDFSSLKIAHRETGFDECCLAPSVCNFQLVIYSEGVATDRVATRVVV